MLSGYNSPIFPQNFKSFFLILFFRVGGSPIQKDPDYTTSWQGLLFRHYGGEPLTSQQFTKKLREGHRVIGLPPQFFSAHSFRIMAAISAAVAGRSED